MESPPTPKVIASKHLFKNLGNSWGMAVAALLLYGLIVIGRLATFSWDPSMFVLAGEGLSNPSRVPQSLNVIRGAMGYDGQAYYRLALDPFTDKRVDHGITLDTPSYRQQRIGYPLLVWVFSFGGRATIVPWVMIVINVLALGAITWIGGALARALGRPQIWGALIALFPGFVVSLARDLGEPLAAACMLGGILLIIRKQSTWGALALAAGVITRETTVLVPLGLAIVYLIPRRTLAQPRSPAREFVVPLGLFAAWQLFLYARWDSLPVLANKNATDPPFLGLVKESRNFISARAYLSLAEIALMLMFCVLIIALSRKASAEPFLRVAALGGVLLMVILDHTVWSDHAHFLRAFTETYVVGSVVAIPGLSQRAVLRIAALVVAIWVPVTTLLLRRL